MDALTSSTPGIIPQIAGLLNTNLFLATPVFVNHATLYMYTRLKQGQTLIESTDSKAVYEKMAANFAIRVIKFHTDNGIFAEESFKSDVLDNNQTTSYCRAGVHFQNEIAEDAIK